jgi:iron(III) transport system substrate-binding protein
MLGRPAQSKRGRDEIQIADPNSSGTAYTAARLGGADDGRGTGLRLPEEALHKNFSQYTKSGAAPVKAARAARLTVGIVFMHDAVVDRP